MKALRFIRSQWSNFAFAALMLCVLSGCATSGDEDDVSAMPWNRPTGYESGINPNLLRGR